MATDEIVELDAIALSRSIRERRISCREVMRAYLDRIELLNPVHNSIVALQPRQQLLAQADERDAQLARGQWLGWMHGMPQAIKDTAQAKGITTTFGSRIFRDFVPAEDSLIVERVRRAGAILIGKTNVPEFGYGSHTYNEVYGVTRNAWDPSVSAGGSSGGAASALALRMLPVADGSDVGGSLRNPAAFNNVFGMRPSTGVVPAGPALDLFVDQLATEGPMARNVADLAMLLSTQAGYDARAPLSHATDPAAFAGPLQIDASRVRIGWLGDFERYLPVEAGILDLCRQALHVLQQAGCAVDEARLGFEPERLWKSFCTLRSWSIVGRHKANYEDAAKRALMKPEAIWEVEQGLNLSAPEVHRASVERSAWYRHALSMFERYDFLALPSAQVFPFPVETHWPREIAGRAMDTYHRWMEVVIGPTLAALPAISVPVGFSAEGLPMGMQLIGRPRGDLEVLRLAHAYDEATRWSGMAPPVRAPGKEPVSSR